MKKPARLFKKPKQPEWSTTNQPAGADESLLLEIKAVLDKVEPSCLPTDLKEEVKESLMRLNRAMKHAFYQAEFEQTTRYVEWLLSLPWNKRTTDNLEIKKAKEILDKNHYGLEQIKERILEYLAVLKLQSEREETTVVKLSRSPILCFVGLPGTGKTSLASSIAESLGRAFIRIPMGGISSPLTLRGQPHAYPEAEPGMIIKAIRRSGTKNPVVLLDEIDSIAQGAE